MDFFLNMMPREIIKGNNLTKTLSESNLNSLGEFDNRINKSTIASPVPGMASIDDLHKLKDKYEEALTNTQHFCNPLCEKAFKPGDVIRKIMPCGHMFHEKCIKVWLFRGEHQYCPSCRGNIIKDSFKIQK